MQSQVHSNRILLNEIQTLFSSQPNKALFNCYIKFSDEIQLCTGLPKTRSGKIMRRILRKITIGKYDELGDISTLADPSVVEEIVDGHANTSKPRLSSTS